MINFKLVLVAWSLAQLDGTMGGAFVGRWQGVDAGGYSLAVSRESSSSLSFELTVQVPALQCAIRGSAKPERRYFVFREGEPDTVRPMRRETHGLDGQGPCVLGLKRESYSLVVEPLGGDCNRYCEGQGRLETTSLRRAGTAEELNTEGFRLYMRKKHEEAIERFVTALELDEHLAAAHYNLAAVLALTRATDECGHREENAFLHLSEALDLDARWRERAKNDTAFDGVRSTIPYRLLVLGLHVERDARALLRGTELFHCCKWGSQGNFLGTKLAANGDLVLWTRNFTEEGKERLTQYPGRWRTEGDQVILEMSEPYEGMKRFVGQLKIGGIGASIEFPEPIGKLTNSDTSCGDA